MFSLKIYIVSVDEGQGKSKGKIVAYLTTGSCVLYKIECMCGHFTVPHKTKVLQSTLLLVCSSTYSHKIQPFSYCLLVVYVVLYLKLKENFNVAILQSIV